MNNSKVRFSEQLNKWEDLLTPKSWCDYYQALSPKQKCIYNKLLAAIIACKEYVILDKGYESDEDEIGGIFHFILWDNPAIFSLGEYAIWNAVDSDGRKVTIPYLTGGAQNERAYRMDVLSAVKQILKNSEVYTYGELQKELFVHDYIIEHYEYDMTHGNEGERLEPYTVYGALVNKEAVCEGFAKLTKLLLDILGVHTQIVSGKVKKAGSGENGAHAWNVVAIGNSTYHLDVTGDMARTKESDGLLRRDYFNVSDKVMNRENAWEFKNIVWKCNSYKANYVYITGGYVSTEEELIEHIKKKILGGRKLIYIRLNKRTFGNVNAQELINKCYGIASQKLHLNFSAKFMYIGLNGVEVLQMKYE